MRSRIRAQGLIEGADYPRLSQSIVAVHNHRRKKHNEGDERGASTERVNRTSALLAIRMVDKEVQVALQEAGLDWASFDQNAATDDFRMPRRSPDDSEDPDIVDALQDSIWAYRKNFPERDVLDAPGLAYGIIASALKKPGNIAGRLNQAKLRDLQTAKEKLQPLLDDATAQSRGTPLSASVQRIVDKLHDETAVSAWQIVRELSTNHTEYGSNKAAKLATVEEGPAGSAAHPVDEWVQYAQARLNPAYSGEVHGRLLILALAKLDAELDEFLRAQDFLQAVEEEIIEPIDELFIADGEVEFEADSAPLHIDNPASAEQDELGRAAFARTLAERMKRIWNEINADDNAGGDSSFVLHLHGAWGAGKTSLLNLLQDALQTKTGDKSSHDGKWVVVEFNAWRHQYLDPPWWPLLNVIYADGRAQLRKHRGPYKAAKFRTKEMWWRLFTGRKDLMLAAFLFFILAAFAYFWLGEVLANSESFKQFADYTDGLGTILALIGTLLTASLVMSRSLLSGSIRSARLFVEHSVNPMDSLRKHFKRLVEDIELPIAILVDDLDRCRCDYVVKLLEGIQTLFRDSHVIYVLAADRRWIHACFEDSYKEFSGTVNEPGRRLGSLFLEKAVQLSVSVPSLSGEVQQRYWNWLLQADKEDPRKLDRIKTEEYERLKDATTQESVFSVLTETAQDDDEDPLVVQIRREVAVVRLASASVEKSTKYFLSPFAPLLDPNPRSMKRFVNAYALQRDLALLAGLDILDLTRRKQLALWTIISLRWPLVEEYLIELAMGKAFEPDDDIRVVIHSASVRKVLDGSVVKAILDLGAIKEFAALSGSESPEGVVA